MAKSTDQEVSDLREAIKTALGEIAERGLSPRTVWAARLPELFASVLDFSDPGSETVIIDLINLITRLADRVADTRRRLALFAAFRISPPTDDLEQLGDDYEQRIRRWHADTGLRERVFESQRAWEAAFGDGTADLRLSKPWSDLRPTEQKGAYDVVRRYWTEGRNELADLLLQHRYRDTIGAALTKLISSVAPVLPPRAETIHPSINPTTSGRPVSLSGTVEDALNAALGLCKSHGRAFRTADLLLAVFDLPGGYVAACFDAVEAGLAKSVRIWLTDWTSEMTLNRENDPFEPFTWAEHPDVQRAEDMVVADGGRRVNEVYLLLGVLDGQSNARRQLGAYVDLEQLVHKARVRRHLPDRALPSPDPTNVRPPVVTKTDVTGDRTRARP